MSEVLILLTQIKPIPEAGAKNQSQISEMFDSTVNRLPVSDAPNVVKYVVHQSMLFEFFSDQALTTGQ